jgi:hypothetical protein
MLSGEGVSGTQETAFGAADMFTSIMMDQGAFWRNGETIDVNGVAFAGEPLQYAPSKKRMADHPVFKEMAPPPNSNVIYAISDEPMSAEEWKKQYVTDR